MVVYLRKRLDLIETNVQKSQAADVA